MIKRSVYIYIMLLLCILLESPYREASADIEGSEAVILYDGSGSMKGFFPDSITDLNVWLHDILSGLHLNTESQVFVTVTSPTKLYPLSEFLKQPVWGQKTKLDDAFSMASNKQVVLLVTDNVQDSGEEGYSSTRNFYNLIEDTSIGTVFLIPAKLPFSGRLYFDKDRYPDPGSLLDQLKENNPKQNIFHLDHFSNKRYNTVQMEGERALAVYIAFRSEFPKKKMQALLDKIKHSLETDPLVVKPIDQGKFFLKGISDKVVVEYALGRLEKLCGGEAGKQLSLPSPNLRLEPPPCGLFSEFCENSYELRPFSKERKDFVIDQTNRFRFYFTMVNQTQGIVLGNHDCPRDLTINLIDVQYKLHPSFRKMFKKSSEIQANILPSFIPDSIPPEGEIMEEDLPVFLAEMTFPPFQMERSIKSIMKMAFTHSIPFKVKGIFEVVVPPRLFSLEESFDDLYFSRESLNQSRIYSPEDIVHYISTKPVSMKFTFTADKMSFTPPAWPRIIVFTLIGAFFLMVCYIMLFLSGHYYLLFNDTGKAVDIYLPIPFTKKIYARNNLEIFLVKRGLWGYLIFPADSYHMENSEGKAVSKEKLKRNTTITIVGPLLKTIIETISSEKYSSVETETLMKRKNKRKTVSEKEKDQED